MSKCTNGECVVERSRMRELEEVISALREKRRFEMVCAVAPAIITSVSGKDPDITKLPSIIIRMADVLINELKK